MSGRGAVAPVAGALLAALLAACRAEPPGRVERAAAAFVKHHLTVGGAGDRNPVPDTPELAARGQETFRLACAACHGADGRTDGVAFAGAMSPPVPSLASAEVQAYTDGQLHWIVANGLSPSGMPAWRDLLSDEEIWRIVRWLRRLPSEPAVAPAAGAPAAAPRRGGVSSAGRRPGTSASSARAPRRPGRRAWPRPAVRSPPRGRPARWPRP